MMVYYTIGFQKANGFFGFFSLQNNANCCGFEIQRFILVAGEQPQVIDFVRFLFRQEADEPV
jgi:hypothetical protein